MFTEDNIYEFEDKNGESYLMDGPGFDIFSANSNFRRTFLKKYHGSNDYENVKDLWSFFDIVGEDKIVFDKATAVFIDTINELDLEEELETYNW